MARPQKMENFFKPDKPVRKGSNVQGQAGFDNARENIDPTVAKLNNLTTGKLVQSDNRRIKDATNTDAEVSAAVTASHAEVHSHTHASTTGQTTDDHHNESHNINSHVMGDNKIIHTKAAGAITEISLGASGTVLTSGGEGNDMTFSGDMAANTTHSSGDGSDHADVATNTAASHAQAHTAASHSDQTASGANVDTAVVQTHDVNHIASSHTDQTATGVQLNALVGDQMADTLHRHSELSASDGTPNPAVSVNATGHTTFVRGVDFATDTIGESSDGWDTRNINVLFITTVDDPVTIGGFSNGVDGQVLYLVKLDNDNATVIEHNEGSGVQNIIFPNAADYTFNNALATGGMTLVCNGSVWYVISVYG